MKTLVRRFQDINVIYTLLYCFNYTIENIIIAAIVVFFVHDVTSLSMLTIVLVMVGCTIPFSFIASRGFYNIAKEESEASLAYTSKGRLPKHKKFCRILLKTQSISYVFYKLFVMGFRFGKNFILRD